MSERAPSFETLAAEFERRVERTIWCTFATVDKRGRVRSRLVHPLWEGKVGWLLTGRTSHKARDLDANPSASLDLRAGASHGALVDVATDQCNGTRTRVIPGDPENSYLLDKILGVDMCFGSKMPKMSSLSATEIESISSWICAGAPDD